MGLPRTLLHLGDLDLILPAAAAIVAWLLAGRAWRLAFWWSLLYAVAVGLVGSSKIAYMAWGHGVPALAFKSISGHATGAMAVYPMLFYLLLHSIAPRLREAGLAFGITVALTVAALLVRYDEHSAAEALAGCLLGAMASLGSLQLARHRVESRTATAPSPPAWRQLVTFALAALAFAVLAWLMRYTHPGYWMIKAARALSGNRHVYPLSID